MRRILESVPKCLDPKKGSKGLHTGCLAPTLSGLRAHVGRMGLPERPCELPYGPHGTRMEPQF